jgi:aminomethyltransferase
MSVVAPTPLKKTPLHAAHLAAGARMVDFGGWEMPVEYSGITDEHMAVRERAGVFDVSHMGEIEIAGPDALRAVQAMTCNDASRLAVGQAQYSALTTPAGTFIDDVLVYRWAETHYLLVVNASNVPKASKWVSTEAAKVGGDLDVVNSSARYALIAVQGPAAIEVLQELTTVELASLRYYWFAPGEVAGVRAMVSRTGYTGELGFELFVAPSEAVKVWNAVLAAGRGVDIRPCGLGARDTLRLEACMRLYGNEMDESVTVLEAGLEWIVKWDKGPFTGREALAAQKADGLGRRLVAFEVRDRAIARHGHVVIAGGAPCGVVTSGTQTPFLKKAIGLAMVPVAFGAVGTALTIDVRGRHVAAEVVEEPFYRRPAKPARSA